MQQVLDAKNVFFVDYVMMLLSDGSIMMDSEMTLSHLRATLGDRYKLELNDEGRIILQKVKKNG